MKKHEQSDKVKQWIVERDRIIYGYPKESFFVNDTTTDQKEEVIQTLSF